MGLISTIIEKCKKFYLNYSLVTALYMMEPWEKTIINSIVIVMLATILYSSWVYLPHYTLKMLGFLGIISNGNSPTDQMITGESSIYDDSSPIGMSM